MVRIVKWAAQRPQSKVVTRFLARSAFPEEAEKAAAEVLSAIRTEGDAAVARHVAKFEGARLTPKPSRIRMGRYQDEASWVEEYDRRRRDYAVCRFICAKGRRLNGSAIFLHDERTLCESDLPLA